MWIRGSQYKTAIFYMDSYQQAVASLSKAVLYSFGLSKGSVATRILKASHFYEAEQYHQGYHEREYEKYCAYKQGSGRADFIKKTWKGGIIGKIRNGGYKRPGDDELRLRLLPMQLAVAIGKGTEPAFDNEYWDNKSKGLYVDVLSAEPLFSSAEKFDSGTGWPSFTRPIAPGLVVYQIDKRLGMMRIEAISKTGRTHLGHVFEDGPPPYGIRFCMNSSSLRFVPYEDMEGEGYGEFKALC
jgi:peptide methionine sulfoxide reductase msrA/msrB